MTLALKGKYEYNLMCEKIYAVLNDYQYMAAALLRTPPNVFPIFYNETGWTFTGTEWVCFEISCIFLLNIIWNLRKIAFQECEKTIEHGIILFHPLYFIPKMGLMHFLFYLLFKICSKQSRCSKVNWNCMFATIHNIQTPWTYKLCTWPPCIILTWTVTKGLGPSPISSITNPLIMNKCMRGIFAHLHFPDHHLKAFSLLDKRRTRVGEC